VPQTDKHLPLSPFTGQFLKNRLLGFESISYLVHALYHTIFSPVAHYLANPGFPGLALLQFEVQLLLQVHHVQPAIRARDQLAFQLL
jgi:hypothetical protein